MIFTVISIVLTLFGLSTILLELKHSLCSMIVIFLVKIKAEDTKYINEFSKKNLINVECCESEAVVMKVMRAINR